MQCEHCGGGHSGPIEHEFCMTTYIITGAPLLFGGT
eukprot:UN14127